MDDFTSESLDCSLLVYRTAVPYAACPALAHWSSGLSCKKNDIYFLNSDSTGRCKEFFSILQETQSSSEK